MERTEFTSCRGGEGGSWLGNNEKDDGREVQVCFGHGELSGSGSACASCSSQALPMRSRNASQWCRVRMRRGVAQKARRCCLLHLHGAPSASDNAVEGDAEAVVQAPVVVVVE